jgi:hypothetical protein
VLPTCPAPRMTIFILVLLRPGSGSPDLTPLLTP